MKLSGNVHRNKPFIKKKLKYTLISVVVVGFIFICYQFLSVKQLSEESVQQMLTKKKDVAVESIPIKNIFSNNISSIIRGINPMDINLYIANDKGKFTCLLSKKQIDFHFVNDDYCDCPEDGSDEPGTNACVNGKFFCESTEAYSLGFLVSSRINDGICDCCDGSDEWLQIFPSFRLPEPIQSKLRRFHSPCPNLCPDDVG